MVDTATDARSMEAGDASAAGALTAEGFARVTDAILDAVGSVIDGKPDAVRSALVCLLASVLGLRLALKIDPAQALGG